MNLHPLGVNRKFLIFQNQLEQALDSQGQDASGVYEELDTVSSRRQGPTIQDRARNVGKCCRNTVKIFLITLLILAAVVVLPLIIIAGI